MAAIFVGLEEFFVVKKLNAFLCVDYNDIWEEVIEHFVFGSAEF